MAIAFDAASSQSIGAVSSANWSHTITGSNTFLVVYVITFFVGSPAVTVTSVDLNGVQLTQLDAFSNHNVIPNTDTDVECWYLAAPATGTQTITVNLSATTTSAYGVGVSYTGVDQTSPIDSHNIQHEDTNQSSVIGTTTVVNSNCWLLGFAWNDQGTVSAASGQTSRFNTGGVMAADMNGTVSPGSNTMTWNTSVGSDWPGFETLSITPPLSPPPPLTSVYFDIIV